MDIQDHRKTKPTGHESYVCLKCGWPFPNSHPSAKHRRAHKRICGTIEGYNKLTHSDDEDPLTPSPKSGIKEMGSGGVGERSNRSEDEFYSDAVTEFSDSGFSPESEERFVAVQESDKNVAGIVKVDATKDARTEVFAASFYSINGSVSELKTLGSEPKDCTNASVANAGVQVTTSLRQESDLKDCEQTNLSKNLSEGVPCIATGGTGRESEMCFNVLEMDPKTSDSVVVVGIAEAEGSQSYGLGNKMSIHDLTPGESSANRIQFDAESVQDRVIDRHGDLLEVCGTNGEMNEGTHAVLVGNNLSSVKGPAIVLEELIDHKEKEADHPSTLDSGEEIRFVEEDSAMISHSESHLGTSLINPGEKIIVSNVDTILEDKEEDGKYQLITKEVPVGGETDFPAVKIINGKELESSGLETNTSKSKAISSEDFGSNGVDIEISEDKDSYENLGSCGIEALHSTIRTGTKEIQTNSCQVPSEFNEKDPADIISLVNSIEESSRHTASVIGGEEVNDQECHKLANDSTERFTEEKLSENTSEYPESVGTKLQSKVNQTADLQRCNDPEKSGTEFHNILVSESTEPAVELKFPRKSERDFEFVFHFNETHLSDKVLSSLEETKSPKVNGATNSSSGDTDMIDLKNTTNTFSRSQNYQDETSKAAVSADTGSNHNRENYIMAMSSENPNILEAEALSVNSACKIKSCAIVNDIDSRDGFGGVSVSSEHLQEDGNVNLTKLHSDVPAVDTSSQTDSLEGNWGSVSVLSTQSEAAPIENEALTLEGTHVDKSDVFEPPSFMTLVETNNEKAVVASEVDKNKHANSEVLEAGWFPSITNVVNESVGRKKNEEIIAKLTNRRSPENKQQQQQYSALKSFAGEANLETNTKSSPKLKQTDRNVIQDDDGITVGGETVNNSESKKEMRKEQNTTTTDNNNNKKEKRKVKGKPQWMPFICCSSRN